MRFHIHPFRGRVILFNGLLVRIIRNIANMRNLDAELDHLIKELEGKTTLLEGFRQKLVSAGEKEVKSKTVDQQVGKAIAKKVKAADQDVQQLQKAIVDKVMKVGKVVAEELEGYEEISIDDDTLFSRKARFLEHLIRVVAESQVIVPEGKKRLLKDIDEDAKHIVQEVEHLTSGVFNLTRGKGKVGVATVMLNDVSVRRSTRLEDLMRRKAIEIAAIEKRLGMLQQEDIKGLLALFDLEMMDIYTIGEYKDILLRRLRSLFTGIKRKLQPYDVKKAKKRLEQTSRLFEAVFAGMIKTAKKLKLDIGNYEKEIAKKSEAERAKIVKEEEAKMQKYAAMKKSIEAAAKAKKAAA